MATIYFSWAFPAPAASLAGRHDCLEDTSHLIKGEACLLMSASRNNWLLGTISNVCAELGLENLPALQAAFASFSIDEIPSVVGEIDSIFAFANESPNEFARILHHSFDAESVSSGLQSSVEATKPHLGPSGADEGDSPEYLFCWLKSLRVLLMRALESERCVVHVQPRWQA
jgi:hypothetical protein